MLLGKPNVYGSIFRFDGQASVFYPGRGPCYRCLYPEPPPPGEVPSCAEGGVLGILPGLIGCIQATEAVKLHHRPGRAAGRTAALYDALQMSFREFKVRRNPNCPMCGDHPTIKQLIDYDQFCGIRGEPAAPPAVAAGEITVEELKARLDRGEAVFILDVRNPEEYQICRLAGQHAPAAAGAAATAGRAGPRARDGGSLQERHAQPAGDSIPARARLHPVEEPQGRHSRMG